VNNTFQGWFTFSSRVTGLVHFCLHFLSVQHHDAAHYSAFKKKIDTLNTSQGVHHSYLAQDAEEGFVSLDGAPHSQKPQK